MFYKFNQAAGRVQVSESALSAQAAAPSVGEVTHIPAYKAGTGGGSGLSQVKALQAFFKVTGHDAPVHLRGARDQLIYRGVMGFSVVGIAVTFYGIYLMATGTMPKKERR